MIIHLVLLYNLVYQNQKKYVGVEIVFDSKKIAIGWI